MVNALSILTLLGKRELIVITGAEFTTVVTSTKASLDRIPSETDNDITDIDPIDTSEPAYTVNLSTAPDNFVGKTNPHGPMGVGLTPMHVQ